MANPKLYSELAPSQSVEFARRELVTALMGQYGVGSNKELQRMVLSESCSYEEETILRWVPALKTIFKRYDTMDGADLAYARKLQVTVGGSTRGSGLRVNAGWPHGREVRRGVRHRPEKTSAYWVWSLARINARRAVRQDLRRRGVAVDDLGAAAAAEYEFDLAPGEQENVLWYAWCMLNHAYACNSVFDKVQPGTWEQPVSDAPLGTPLQLSAVPLSYSTMCMPQLIADHAVRPTDLAWTVVIQNLFDESDDSMYMKHHLLCDPDNANTLQRKPLDPGERAVRLVRAWQHLELNMGPLQEQQYEVLQSPFGHVVSLLEPRGHDLVIGVQPPPDGWPSFKTFLPHGYLDVPGFYKGPDDVANVRRFSDTAYHPHALFRMRQRFEDEGKKAAAARLLRSQLAHATSEADEDERRRGDRRSREDAGRLDRDFGQPWGTVPWLRSAPTAEHVDMARRTTNGEGSPRIPRYPGATAIAQRDRMEIKRSRTAPYEVPPTAYPVGYDAVPASVTDPNYRYEGRRRTAAHTEPIHAHAQQEPIRRAFAEEYGWRQGDESGFEAPRWDSGASAYAAGANDWYYLRNMHRFMGHPLYTHKPRRIFHLMRILQVRDAVVKFSIIGSSPFVSCLHRRTSKETSEGALHTCGNEQTYVYPPNESNEYDPENWRMI
ncbi:hypothetical protein FVE85_7761 [Porphyridium purpureum]|uniref:Uncharacterized protein n=1 Tax=Porphyridium purpureum TaxID=35688 RepID=A0A5J4YKC5_PORPP|nr:hypothetical protein FVE85_7761 [Porphyridium purpureum]|eukprot:POR4106..scf210_14